MIWTVTVTRTGLSLADLVITNNPVGATYWLPEEGLEEPDQEYRRTYMPDHPDIHGKELLSAVLEHTNLPLQVYATAATAADLRAAKVALMDAFGQFSYSVTVDVDGESWGMFSADPAGIRWGAVDSGMVRAHLARASLVVPVYPIAS